MKIPPFYDHLVVEDINLSYLSTLLQCTRVQRFHKICFIYLFILLLFFLMKVNLCLKLADGSDEYHKCAIMSQIFVYIFWWILFLAKKWNKVLKWLKWKMQVIKLLYIAMFEGGNNLCGERSGSAKEIARDTLHIRIAVACISIFDLLMIRYSCIWLSNIW